MQLSRNGLFLVLGVLVVWYGWTTVGVTTGQTVTLTVTDVGRSESHFARLWVVEEHPYLWIRAERPDRRWLGAVREQQVVTLSRDQERGRYAPTVWDDAESREFVDGLFRVKYGVVDLVRSLLFPRESVPVRLSRLPDDAGDLGRR